MIHWLLKKGQGVPPFLEGPGAGVGVHFRAGFRLESLLLTGDVLAEVWMNYWIPLKMKRN
jgi:hypothetical protein